MSDTPQVQKRGYLNESFRLFHLKDLGAEEMAYHYHEFDKVVLFLDGTASYIIEGRSYFLQPGDVLLVSRHLIHKPVIDQSRLYERVVIYLDPDFLAGAGADLSACFREAARRQFALMRPSGEDREEISRLVSSLERALVDPGFGAELLARTYLFQLMIFLNRLQDRDRTGQEEGVTRFDPKVVQVLNFINANLADDLSVERLAAMAYTSKYHFMRLFQEQTGYSIHRYVTEKRLLAAAALLREGTPAIEAGTRCGFQDYSTFFRAFKRQFGVSPRAMR